MASLGRRSGVRDGAVRRRYVARFAWPRRLPGPANNNRAPRGLARMLPLAAGVALLVAAVWAVAA